MLFKRKFKQKVSVTNYAELADQRTMKALSWCSNPVSLRLGWCRVSLAYRITIKVRRAVKNRRKSSANFTFVYNS